MAIPLPARFLPLVATALSPTLLAQTPWSDGSLVGLPTMYSVTQSTKLTDLNRGAEGYSKPAGFSSATPKPMIVVGGPDFSATALFGRCSQLRQYPEIDAFSLGLDILPTTPDGKIKVGANRWVGIIYSVASGATGQKGSRIGAENDPKNGNYNGADMFNYVYKGSSCLPADMIGTTFRAWDAAEAGLPNVAQTELDALDAYASLYELGMAAELGMSPNPTFYFSVSGSKDSLARVPDGWWINPKQKSGAAIFSTQWDSKKRAWRCPKEIWPPKRLGLKPCEDIDALAIDGPYVMFSTRRATETCPVKRNQLLFTDLSVDAAAAVTVTYDNDEPVTNGLGLGDVDDIDALCGLDPTCNLQGNRLQIERMFGYSNGTTPRLPFPKLEVQAYRRRTPGRTEFYAINMVGGAPGQFAVLLASPPGGFGRGLFVPIGATVVPQRSPFDGNPIAPMLMPVPPGITKGSIELTFLSFFLPNPRIS